MAESTDLAIPGAEDFGEVVPTNYFKGNQLDTIEMQILVDIMSCDPVNVHSLDEVANTLQFLQNNHVSKSVLSNCLEKVQNGAKDDMKRMILKLMSILSIMKSYPICKEEAGFVRMLQRVGLPEEAESGTSSPYPRNSEQQIKKVFSEDDQLLWLLDYFAEALPEKREQFVKKLNSLINNLKPEVDINSETLREDEAADQVPKSFTDFFSFGYKRNQNVLIPPVIALACTEDTIAISYGDNSVGVFRPNGPFNFKIMKHNDVVFSLVFLENLVVAGGSDGIITLFDATTCERLCSSKSRHSSDVICLVTNGDVLISGSEDRRMISWSVNRNQDGNIVAINYQDCVDFEGRVKALALHGEYVAAACNYDAAVWHLVDGSWQANHPSTVTSVALHSGILVTGCLDPTVRIWNLETRQQIAEIAFHCSPIAAVYIDGQRIITACQKSAICVWRRSEIVGATRSKYSLVERCLAPLQEPITSIAVSGSVILAAHENQGQVSVTEMFKDISMPITVDGENED